MRLLTIADTHIGANYPYSQRDPNGYSLRQLDILSIFEEIYGTYYKDWDVGVHAGDFFDHHHLDGEALQIAAKIIRMIESNNRNFYILKGNHDDDGKVNVLQHYLNFPLKYTHFITKSKIVDTCVGIDFIFVCWDNIDVVRNDIRLFRRSLENKKNWRSIVVVGHFPVKGSQFGKAICKYGITTDELNELMKLGINFTVLGHHHRSQYFHHNIFYTGSPFQKDFSEAGEEHGFHIIDFKIGQFKFIKSNAPTFVEIHHTEVKKTVSFRNKIVRIIFDGPETNNLTYIRRIKELVGKRHARYVITKVKRPVMKRSIGLKVDHMSTPIEMLNTYANKMIQRNRIDEFKKAGKEILDEAVAEGII